METNTLSPTEKHQRALAIARRMMQNKRQVQAETLAYFKEHPEELAQIKENLKRLEAEKLVDSQ